MKRIRVEWQIGGEVVLDLPDDYDDEAISTCAWNALGQASDGTADHFENEFEDGEVVSFEASEQFSTHEVPRNRASGEQAHA